MSNPIDYNARIKRVNDSIELKEPDRVPIVPLLSALPYFLSGDTTYRDSMYRFGKARAAIFDYYKTFMPDAIAGPGFTSGKANELAGSTMIDWPGRPGTCVPDFSTHQAIEHEYMMADEYPELLRDFTGFMLRKYIPRAFPGVAGLASFDFVPSIVLSISALPGLYASSALEAFDRLREIAACEAEVSAEYEELMTALAELGLPPWFNLSGEAPFDILSDYYRGTIGTFEDLAECPDMIAKACDLFADIQIEKFVKLKDMELPIKRIHFPLHKGMDGFMSPKQYAELYWKPLRKVMMALIEADITPIIYTEGPYNTRIEQLADVPRGKVVCHFEDVDMENAKRVLGSVACLSGNLPIYLLEYGTKQQVIDASKRLIDICAPGGGYIFDTNACIDNAKRENIEAMFETVMIYGKR